MNPRRKMTPETTANNRKYVDLIDLCNYVALGRNSALKLAKAAGAERKFGRRLIFDLSKIDEYFDRQQAD